MMKVRRSAPILAIALKRVTSAPIKRVLNPKKFVQRVVREVLSYFAMSPFGASPNRRLQEPVWRVGQELSCPLFSYQDKVAATRRGQVKPKALRERRLKV